MQAFMKQHAEDFGFAAKCLMLFIHRSRHMPGFEWH